MSKSIAATLKAAKSKAKKTPPHLMISARAGTGKTTTLVEGLKVLKGLPTAFTPSEQQAAIWASLALSGDARTVCFVAFNKSIATELASRIPAGCEAMTMHSMGFKAVNKAFTRLRVNEHRVTDLIAKELGRDIYDLRKEKPTLLAATKKLVGLVKMNLAETSIEALTELASHYDVEMDGCRADVFDLVPKIVDRCRDPLADGCLDFDDMVWLPVALDLPMFRYDLLLIDEAQDLNRCQQAIAKKCGTRLVFCGDERQAIYGFAGADSESMPRLAKELKANVLPLTVTRRCGKKIVEEAKRHVPDFSAFETNPEGVVRNALYPIQPGAAFKEKVDIGVEKSYLAEVRDGDFVVCRSNAPLVNQCFKMIRMGKKATIQGRDVGQGLISLVKKLDARTVPELVTKLNQWTARELDKEQAKKNPSETRIQGIEDKSECLMAFVDNAATVDGVVRKIEELFTDRKDQPGVRLSSIHKAKGLESQRVYFLRPAVQPVNQRQQKAWVADQEANLVYVAVTRAISELVFVY